MYFTPYDINEFEREHRAKNSNFKILNEFLKSGLACAKIDCSRWCRPEVARQTLRGSVRRFHMNDIQVTIRGDEVFLINKALVKE